MCPSRTGGEGEQWACSNEQLGQAREVAARQPVLPLTAVRSLFLAWRCRPGGSGVFGSGPDVVDVSVSNGATASIDLGERCCSLSNRSHEAAPPAVCVVISSRSPTTGPRSCLSCGRLVLQVNS